MRQTTFPAPSALNSTPNSTPNSTLDFTLDSTSSQQTHSSLPRRWLLIHLDDPFSMVSLEPIIHLIQHHIPAAQITLLSSSPAHAQSLPQVSHWPIHLDTQNPSWPVGINWILELHHRPFDAVLLLTPPGRSPYALAYACYLANIPLRFGQSLEFGGGLLSTWVKPPLDPPDCLEDYYLHLVRSVWGQMGWDGGTQMNTDKHR